MFQIPTLYKNYQELLLDLDILGKILSESLVNKDELRDLLFDEYKITHPLPTLEDKRYELSDLVSSDYHISYASEIELAENEHLVDLEETEDTDFIFEDNIVVPDSIKEYCGYGSVTDAVREDIIKRFLTNDIEEFEQEGIEQLEGVFNTVESHAVVYEEDEDEYEEEVIDNLESDDDDDDSYFFSSDDSEDDDSTEDDDSEDDDSYFFSSDDSESESEDDEDDDSYFFSSDDSEDDDSEDDDSEDDDSEDDDSEDDDGYFFSSDDSEDDDSEDDDGYFFSSDDSEDDEEDSQSVESTEDDEDDDSYFFSSSDDEEDNSSSIEDNDNDSYSFSGKDTDIEDSYSFPDDDFIIIDDVQPKETDEVITPVPTPVEIINKNKKNYEQVVEQPKIEVNRESEPKDLREFIRKHPRCEVSFALQYFSRKEIEKYIMLGKVIKKGTKLHI